MKKNIHQLNAKDYPFQADLSGNPNGVAKLIEDIRNQIGNFGPESDFENANIIHGLIHLIRLGLYGIEDKELKQNLIKIIHTIDSTFE